jgi:hypothetical protein
MAMQLLPEDIGEYEKYLSAKRFVTVEDQVDEYDPPSLTYLDHACILTGSTINVSEDVTPQVVTLSSLCTAIVRSPAIGDVVVRDLYRFTGESMWYGDHEATADSFELRVTSRGPNDDRAQVLDELLEMYKEYSVENWDGCNTEPVSQKAYLEAERFISLLPASLDAPGIIPEPNGEIALEWYRGRRFIFVASLSGDSTISFAGLFGRTSKIHGSEYFGDRIPDSVIGYIHRLLEGA